jgi:23S rRNA pseudouridine1911/1915/1917 synthase
MSVNSPDDSLVEFIITDIDLDQFKRLDTYLSSKLPDISRSLIKKLFKDGSFTSESKIEFKKMPKSGTKIQFVMPELEETNILPENLPLDIVFEDDYLIIVNKAPGMVVHPAPGNYTGTLVNAILHHCPDLQGIGNERRPGIVHRLDKGTSGIMVIAKEQRTHNGLVELFSTHDIDRKYQAICVSNKLPEKATLEAPIGRSPNNRLKMATNVSNSKHAITYLKSVKFFNKLTHVELTLETGRTHQIRVHLSELQNAPILNDKTYGRIKDEKQRLTTAIKNIIGGYEHPFLHARILGFIHPITKEKMFFEKEPPELFQLVLTQLEKESE